MCTIFLSKGCYQNKMVHKNNQDKLLGRRTRWDYAVSRGRFFLFLGTSVSKGVKSLRSLSPIQSDPNAILKNDSKTIKFQWSSRPSHFFSMPRSMGIGSLALPIFFRGSLVLPIFFSQELCAPYSLSLEP